MNLHSGNRSATYGLKSKLIGGIALALVCASTGTVRAHNVEDSFPTRIELPNGFRPEGITFGRGSTFYVGGILTGAIYRADARTGEGAVLVPPQEGRAAAGLKYDARTNYLYAAGLRTGSAYVYNATTGANIATLKMSDAITTNVNDIAITRDAVFFTDSARPVIYRLPLGAGGRLNANAAISEIPLTGDFQYLPNGLNANGIVAIDSKTLVVNHTDLGRLYRVDVRTGTTKRIDLGVERVGQDGSDGLVLIGRTVYIIDYYDELIPIQLNRDQTVGKVLPSITSPDFANPSTAALFGGAFYVVNAKLGIENTPDITYWVTRVKI